MGEEREGERGREREGGRGGEITRASVSSRTISDWRLDTEHKSVSSRLTDASLFLTNSDPLCAMRCTPQAPVRAQGAVCFAFDNRKAGAYTRQLFGST